MNNKTFSVIIPIYKVEKYIEQCITSVLAQTFTDFEVLCVDDCGGDKSIDIVEKYAKIDNRIKIFRHPYNKSQGAARNTGLEHSCGKYICCVDSDDFVEKEMLEKVHNAFNEYPEVDSVWIKYLVYDEKKNPSPVDKTEPPQFCPKGFLIDITDKNIHYFPGYPWNKIYKADYIRKNNFYWPEKLCFEDLYFCYSYFLTYHKIYFINEFLYNYRVNQDSIIRNLKPKQVEDMYRILDMIVKKIEEKGLSKNYIEGVIKFELDFKTNLYISGLSCPEADVLHDEFLLKMSKKR